LPGDHGEPRVSRAICRAPTMRVLGLYSWPSLWSLGRGSGANSFWLSPHAFVQFGHEIHMSLPLGWGEPRFEDDQGLKIHRYRGAIRFESNPRRILPLRLLSRVGRYAYYVVIGSIQGVRLGRRIKPDLVIGYGVPCAVIAPLVARVLGVPNVTRLYGLQLLLYKNRVKRLGAFMEILALKAPASYIIIHNDGSEGNLAARMAGVPERRLRFWRDGLDPLLQKTPDDLPALRRRLRIPDDHTVLFSVGRFGEDKKMGRLVEILPDILKEEPRVTLMLVGDGPDRPELERRIRDLGVEDHAVVTGAAARVELPGYFGLGDIFVAVSDRTNANLAPIEAMCLGKPVVALATGGTRELIRDGQDGVLVEPGAWRSALPRVLIDLIGDPQKRRDLGDAARERVERMIPKQEERLRMEVDLCVQAVREFRERKAGAHRQAQRTSPGSD
jgi:glycosyltransferase involved in cell wall biosynthesis